jgi:26S proteasome regulatory subunit N2
MAVGIAMAGTADPKVLTMLEGMMEDLTDFVRQGAMLATSMVLMQSSDTKRAEAFRTKITGIVAEKVSRKKGGRWLRIIREP